MLASILGALIGLEREIKAKEAGIRTHFLVALAGALIMIVSQHGFNDVIGLSGYGLDPARVAAQVVSGIGFIGAGMIIIRKKTTVKGLTSAAGLWVTAGIGLAIGGGLHFVGIITSVLTLIAFEMSAVTDKKIDHRKLSFKITITDEKKIIDLYDFFNADNRYLKQYQLEEIENKGNIIHSAKYIVEVQNDENEEKLLKEIQNMENIILKEINYPGDEKTSV